MSYQVQFDVIEDYLRVEVSGTRIPGQEVEAGIKLWTNIIGFIQSKGLTKILLVLNLDGPLSTMAAYKLANAPQAKGWPKTIRAAVVDLNQGSLKENQFAGAVAYNQGYQIEIFNSEETAVKWLNG